VPVAVTAWDLQQRLHPHIQADHVVRGCRLFATVKVPAIGALCRVVEGFLRRNIGAAEAIATGDYENHLRQPSSDESAVTQTGGIQSLFVAGFVVSQMKLVEAASSVFESRCAA
jgi:hypothetical protein